MGWVGVGTLVASTCCLLYRYPPRIWASQPSPPSHVTAGDIPALTTPSGTTTKERPASPREVGRPSESEDESAEEQTTPKASATTAPALEIPALHLDGDGADTGKQEQRLDAPQKGSIMPPQEKSQQPRPRAANSSSLMPPPPRPGLRPTAQQNKPSQPVLANPPRPSAGNSLRPPPSAASSLRAPTSARPAGNSLNPASLTVKPTNTTSKRAILEPGYSPLDWAALKSNPNNNLRGAGLPATLIKVTPSMLRAQNGRKGRDAWTSYQGKVYNISPYLPFHPGGKGELLRGAGKDAAKLFFEVHPWVNWDAILGECLVGVLVGEGEVDAVNSLDAMD